MSSLNIGWWNSSKMNTFKINDLKENDLVISAKKKIMEMALITDLENSELVYCGLIMENMEKISKYVKNNNSLVFIVKKENISTNKTETTKDLQKMLQEYNEASAKPGFKELILSTIRPETINALLHAIPELSRDLIALSIIRDLNLFEAILKPRVMKAQVSLHPALVMCVDYLIHNTIKNMHGKIRSAIHLTDDDYSESDDIEIDYSQPNVSTFAPSIIPGLDFLIQGNRRSNISSFDEDGIIQIPSHDVLDTQSNERGQQIDSSLAGLSSQIHQMHELGLFNDSLNFRALEIAGGNVQHAVELILNRIIE